MISTVLTLLAAVCAANAAAPQLWQPAVINVDVDPNHAASRYEGTITIPELQGDLQISLGAYKEVGFKLCLKQDVAAPTAAGITNWHNPLYCDLFQFTNGTKAEVASFNNDGSRRQRSVNTELRGSGSGVFGASANVNGVRSVDRHISRRSVSASVGDGSIQKKNVRSGTYFLTIAFDSKQKSNKTITLPLQFQGMRCPAASQGGPNCDALPSFMAGVNVTKLAKNARVIYALENYKMITPSTGALELSGVVSHSGNDTAKLVARWGAAPTLEANDGMLDLTNKETKMTIGSPRADKRWYFAVINGNMSVANVNFTVTMKQCKAGEFGADCKVKPAAVGKPGALDAQKDAKKGDVFYYKFHANDTKLAALFGAFAKNETMPPASLSIAAASLEADQHAPMVYARIGMLPTTTEFDIVGCTVAHCPKSQATLIVPENDVAVQHAEWYVMVKAEADGGVGVWNAAGGECASNCGGHGKCDKATASCTCEADYTSFDCGAKKGSLERWEWALIIGGAVLVAIGLIGCIVYFIQKQQRRAGFERV